MAYNAVLQHVVRIGDPSAEGVDSGRRQTDTVEVRQAIDARIRITDAGVVQDHASETALRRVPRVVLAAIGAGDEDVPGALVGSGGAARCGEDPNRFAHAERARVPA